MVGKRRRRPSAASPGCGEVNLRAEWRKLVAYSEGQRITIWRWRGWALKARRGCDRTNTPIAGDTTAVAKSRNPVDCRPPARRRAAAAAGARLGAPRLLAARRVLGPGAGSAGLHAAGGLDRVVPQGARTQAAA